MQIATLREEIEKFYLYLKASFPAGQATILQDDYDLVLNITHIEGERPQWSYYYACHTKRCLFWLENYDASDIISYVKGVQSPAHISMFYLFPLYLL